MTPTLRTYQHCQLPGWTVATLPYNRSLWGFVDVIAIVDKRTLAIMATDLERVKDRRAKMLANHHREVFDWLNAGNKLEVWCWAEKFDRHNQSKGWDVARTPITLTDLTDKPPSLAV